MMKATRFLFIAPALLSSAASFQPTTPFSSRDIIRTTHSQPSFNLQKVETLAKVMSSDSNTSPSESTSISNGVAAVPSRHPHCDLPGDPSLILTTNVDLGDAKGNILKKLSALVATSTGKPEAYVAVCITDKASMVFGGSDDPLALGCVYSLGAINMANNGKIQSGVTDALEPYGVKENRIYINFFDMPRDCVGWNRATFAG